MFISFKKKYIFMHSRKTAGSSITVLLNKDIGPKDIQIGAWPDAIEAGGKYNHHSISIIKGNLNQIIKESIKHSLFKKKIAINHNSINKSIKKYAFKEYGLTNGAHSSAIQVKFFAKEYWDTFFKFAFVRNPWDHAISDYYWKVKNRNIKNVDFKEFLFRLADPHRLDKEKTRPSIITNWSIYTINDKVALDFIGRYENLEKDLKKIENIIGVKLNINSIWSKSNIRKKNKSIADYYDEESIELVRQIYKKEIEEFNYQIPF